MMQKRIVYTEIVSDETRIVVYDAGIDGFGWYIDGVTADGLVFESDDDFAQSLEEAVDTAREYLRQRYILEGGR